MRDDDRQLRRQASNRTPVDNAFYALACLSKEDRQLVVERFNATYSRATPAMRLEILE